jgi:flagellar motor protein MotB
MWQFFVLITCLLTWMGTSLTANAQMQQGYSNERPSIVVDRSVLEDLKGYEPPPMFGDNDEQKEAVPNTKTVIKAPNAETLLSYPTQNFRVLTERKTQSKKTPTAAKASPLSTGTIEAKKSKSNKSASLPKEVKKEEKGSLAGPQKRVIQPETARLSDTKSISPSPAYKPKAAPTMPAVPPISVERDILPALPPTTPESENIPSPSIGERMIDAALERQIEKDNEKIKEKLAKEGNSLVKNYKIHKIDTEKKSVLSISNNSLVFETGQTDLTKTMEIQISNEILPKIAMDIKSRIQILSFATSLDNKETTAKRLSLARALSVRDYLKKMKIDVSRIDVRAVASDFSVPPDRVDIVLLK